eukprot:364557-Chlamydomonas_euryale.AAC.28
MALAQKAFTPAVASRGPVRVSRVEVYARDSRIGARPITLPKGVTVTLSNNGRAMAVKVRCQTSKPGRESAKLAWDAEGGECDWAATNV